jgi:ribulose kinase
VVAVGRCVAGIGVDPTEIVALSVDNACCTVVVIDEEGESLNASLCSGWTSVVRNRRRE